MKISDCIEALEACLDKFGDVEVSFTTSTDGNPAVELKNVDTTNKPDVTGGSPCPQGDGSDDAALEAILRFNARFPVKDLFIASRN